MKKYEICEATARNFKARILITSILALFILGTLLIVDVPLYVKLAGVAIGYIIGVPVYYDLKNLNGTKKNGYSVNLEEGSIEYFNEFKGIKKIVPQEFKSLTIYEKNKKPNLLEFAKEKGKAVETICVIGLSKGDIYSLINDIKSITPALNIIDNKKDTK